MIGRAGQAGRVVAGPSGVLEPDVRKDGRILRETAHAARAEHELFDQPAIDCMRLPFPSLSGRHGSPPFDNRPEPDLSSPVAGGGSASRVS